MKNVKYQGLKELHTYNSKTIFQKVINKGLIPDNHRYMQQVYVPLQKFTQELKKGYIRTPVQLFYFKQFNLAKIIVRAAYQYRLNNRLICT